METYCFVNGDVMPVDDAGVGVNDLALQRGYGVFDFARMNNGKLFHLEDHLQRLRQSAEALRLDVPHTDEEIREIAEELIEKSELESPALRLILTGGYDYPSPEFGDPNFIVIAQELPTYPDRVYEEGAKLITVRYQRELPEVKTINYMNALRLENRKEAADAFDILYHSDNGVTESPRNNFFLFKGDTLVTADENVLLGITRKLVLKLAEERFDVEERRVDLDELAEADEAFVTSTSKRVIPVTQIDEHELGDGSVGERARWIMDRFDTYSEEY